MNSLKKIWNLFLTVPMWIVTLVITVVFFIFDNVMQSIMWQRCLDSDMSDKEAYSYINHCSFGSLLEAAFMLAFVFWVVRSFMRWQIGKRHELPPIKTGKISRIFNRIVKWTFIQAIIMYFLFLLIDRVFGTQIMSGRWPGGGSWLIMCVWTIIGSVLYEYRSKIIK